MKQVVAAALCLLLLLFLLPVFLVRGEPLAEPQPSPQGTLPIEHIVVTPSPAPARRDADTTVKVAMPDGNTAQLKLDEYLWGVVAAEMPASFEPEALKAQAVAARTYTEAKMGHAVESHPDADVCTDITCCQAYISRKDAEQNWGDRAEEYGAKISAAVSETDALIACYNGSPIQAVFFSSAAGKTVDAVEVWGSAVPYLSGVESPEGEEVPNYHTTSIVSLDVFRAAVLANYPDAVLEGDPSAWFSNLVPDSAGGVERMDVGGVSIAGTALRTMFGLRSTHFTVTPGEDSVTFSVTGYGHGVGMSQYGANAMAKEGKDFSEILKWYYTGVTLEQRPAA